MDKVIDNNIRWEDQPRTGEVGLFGEDYNELTESWYSRQRFEMKDKSEGVREAVVSFYCTENRYGLKVPSWFVKFDGIDEPVKMFPRDQPYFFLYNATSLVLTVRVTK